MSDETPRPNRRSLLAAIALMASAAASAARGEQGQAMKHVVLLGDSIFDNKAYVGSGPDVIAQLREALPSGWTATLVALDGSTTADIKSQLKRLPEDASHLVVSIGGNDALQHEKLLEEWAWSVAGVFDKLAKIKSEFQKNYAAMLDRVLATNLPAAVCTIYEARYEDLATRRIANTGLTIFNDAIMREAFQRGVPMIDLRIMFSDDADYANPVEPSVIGGAKLVKAITTLVTTHDFTQRRSEIYV
jgi:lysophospholipase L1-like esterase